MGQVCTYRTMYVCMKCVFSIRLANSEYLTPVCLRILLLTLDLIYTGKLEILSATEEIFAQKLIITRVLVNYKSRGKERCVIRMIIPLRDGKDSNTKIRKRDGK